MGTSADYYIGRGETAEWLGATAWDGYPEGLADSQEGARVFSAATPDDFRIAVNALLASRDDGTTPDQGWPWPWEDSNTTDFSYAFDDGIIWITCFGRGWSSYGDVQARQKKHQGWEDKAAALRGQGLEWEAIEKKIGAEPSSLWDGEKICVFPDMTAVKNVTLGRRSGVIVIGR